MINAVAIAWLQSQYMQKQQFKTAPGLLFYNVYEMSKSGLIDARGKQILKDLIITGSSLVYSAFEDYQSRGTELTLRNDLFRIYKQERDSEKLEGLSDRSVKSRGMKGIKIMVPPKNIQKIPAHLRAT